MIVIIFTHRTKKIITKGWWKQA